MQSALVTDGDAILSFGVCAEYKRSNVELRSVVFVNSSSDKEVIATTANSAAISLNSMTLDSGMCPIAAHACSEVYCRVAVIRSMAAYQKEYKAKNGYWFAKESRALRIMMGVSYSHTSFQDALATNTGRLHHSEFPEMLMMVRQSEGKSAGSVEGPLISPEFGISV